MAAEGFAWPEGMEPAWLNGPETRECHEREMTYVQALRAQDIVARFGRFPHRNAALGRPSTLEETSYLAQPGSGF